MTEEFITWEKIRNIKREEEKGQKLAELPDNFFVSVNNYIEKKSKLGNDYEVKQVKSMLDDIIKIRTKKILLYSVYSADAKKLDNLTQKEEKIQNTIVKIIKDYKENIGLKVPEDEEKDEKEEVETEEVKDINIQKVKIKPGKVFIRVLDDIPEFVGLDMKDYNLKNGDLITIHEEIANLLIDQGKAEKIELE